MTFSNYFNGISIVLLVIIKISFCQELFDANTCGPQSGDQSKGCLFYPVNCVPNTNCTALFSYVLNNSTSRLEMQLSGRLTGNRYVALGFSDDQSMGDDMVVSCALNNGQPVAGLSTNTGKSNAPVTTSGVLMINATSAVNGGVACSFSLPVTPPSGVTGLKRLDTIYYPLVATGPLGSTGQLSYHSTTKSALPRTDFSVYRRFANGTVGVVPTSSTSMDTTGGRSQTEKLLMAHGILMTCAWTTFLSTGILFARHFRHHWPDTTLLGVKMWFNLHRTLNMFGIAATICGFVIIFVANDWKWTGPKATQSDELNRQWGSIHSILGLLACVIAWAQPLNAVFRCHPGTTFRFVFNWIHRFFGCAAWVLAAAAIMIACVHFDAMFSNRKAAMGIYIAYIAVVGVTLIAMEFFSFRRWWRNRGRVHATGEMEMAQMSGSNRTRTMMDSDDDDDDKTNTILLLIMLAFVCLAIGASVAISVLIGLRP